MHSKFESESLRFSESSQDFFQYVAPQTRTEEKYFSGSFQFSFVKIKKKYHLSGNLKFNYLGISQSLKFRILTETILPISLNLNFTPNTLGCLL